MVCLWIISAWHLGVLSSVIPADSAIMRYAMLRRCSLRVPLGVLILPLAELFFPCSGFTTHLAGSVFFFSWSLQNIFYVSWICQLYCNFGLVQCALAITDLCRSCYVCTSECSAIPGMFFWDLMLCVFCCKVRCRFFKLVCISFMWLLLLERYALSENWHCCVSHCTRDRDVLMLIFAGVYFGLEVQTSLLLSATVRD